MLRLLCLFLLLSRHHNVLEWRHLTASRAAFEQVLKRLSFQIHDVARLRLNGGTEALVEILHVLLASVHGRLGQDRRRLYIDLAILLFGSYRGRRVDGSANNLYFVARL